MRRAVFSNYVCASRDRSGASRFKGSFGIYLICTVSRKVNRLLFVPTQGVFFLRRRSSRSSYTGDERKHFYPERFLHDGGGGPSYSSRLLHTISHWQEWALTTSYRHVSRHDVGQEMFDEARVRSSAHLFQGRDLPPWLRLLWALNELILF